MAVIGSFVGVLTIYKYKKIGGGAKVILLYVVASLLSAAFSDHVRQVFGYSILVTGAGLLTIACVVRCESVKHLQAIEKALFVVTVIIIFKNAIHGFVSPLVLHGRLGGGVVSANSIGFMSLAAFWMTYRSTRLQQATLGLVVLRWILAAFVMLSRSRTVMMCLFVSFLGRLWQKSSLEMSFGNKRADKRKLGSALVCLAIGGLAFYFLLVSFDVDFADDLLDLYNRETTVKQIVTLTSRTEIWALAMNQVFDTPETLLFGHGYGTSKWVLSYVGGLSNYYGIPHAHNSLLEFLLGMGLLGMFVYFSMLIYGFKCVRMPKSLSNSNVAQMFMRWIPIWWSLVLFSLMEGSLAERLNYTIFISFFLIMIIDRKELFENEAR